MEKGSFMKVKKVAIEPAKPTLNDIFEGLLSPDDLALLSRTEKLEKKLLLDKRKKKIKAIKDKVKFLCDRFPNCFNLYRPVPLKSGIFHDIKSILSAEGNFEGCSTLYRNALRYYTFSFRYYSSILVQTHRIDLEGNQAEEISLDDKDHVRKLLREKFGDRLRRRKSFKSKEPQQDQVQTEEKSILSTQAANSNEADLIEGANN